MPKISKAEGPSYGVEDALLRTAQDPHASIEDQRGAREALAEHQRKRAEQDGAEHVAASPDTSSRRERQGEPIATGANREEQERKQREEQERDNQSDDQSQDESDDQSQGRSQDGVSERQAKADAQARELQQENATRASQETRGAAGTGDAATRSTNTGTSLGGAQASARGTTSKGNKSK